MFKNEVMKKWMFIPALVGMIACSNEGGNTEGEVDTNDSTAVETQENETAVVLEEGQMLYFGDTVSFENAVTTGEMLAMLEEQGLDSMDVKVQGTVSAVCQKKGCWMSMPFADENMDDLFVSYDYAFLLPTGGIEGEDVVIEGRVKRETYDVDYLRHLAEDAGKSQEEIDAITEPETKLSFLATGVTIRG